jgi:hypothetical protein
MAQLIQDNICFTHHIFKPHARSHKSTFIYLKGNKYKSYRLRGEICSTKLVVQRKKKDGTSLMPNCKFH